MKLYKKLFLIALAAFSTFTIASCNSNNVNPTPNPEPTPEPEPTPDPEPTEWIDYTSSEEARLVLDYKGKEFLTDGIGQVTLKTAIDGDTAHFNEEGIDELIKCRFYGIDTPESTGKIQPWGKAASNFTKEKLKNANENGTIVISVPQDEYTTPSHDSTGSRYLALIWFNETEKNCDYKDLKLLNLLLVQEGYSEVKNATEMERLEPIFRSALDQAVEFKLNMFSGEDDPLYNYGDYEPISLLDMKIELEKQVAAEKNGQEYENKYDNLNVKVVGTVAGYSNGSLYLQNYYTVEDGGRYGYGEYAGINIYCGVSAIPSKFTKLNTYLQVCGTTADSENFGFQISGCSFKMYKPSENDAQILISPEDNNDEFKLYTFEKSALDIKQGDYELINSPVQIEENVRVTGGYTSDSTSVTLYIETEDGQKIDFNVFVSFIYKPDEENSPSIQWKGHEDFTDKVFSLKGLVALHKTSSGNYNTQIILRNSSDLVLIG